MAVRRPESPERSGEAEDELRLPGGGEVIEGGAKIVVLALEPVEPLLGIAAEVRLRLLREREEVLGVTAA
jgi:hypothetical protein